MRRDPCPRGYLQLTTSNIVARNALPDPRGECQQVWSPAPNVYFGQAEHRSFKVADPAVAADWHGSMGDMSVADAVARLGTMRSPGSEAPLPSPSVTAPGG